MLTHVSPSQKNLMIFLRNGGCLFAGLLLLASLAACGSNKLRANMTTEERLAYANQLFQKKNYFDARTQFRIVTLNAPGSTIVDEAQYYLGECHYEMEEFITAAAEYEKLLRLYPQSPFLDDAQYKLGMCYFRLSPKADLDQKYTWRAIEEFQRFLDDFPNSDLKNEVVDKLTATRGKLAKKEYEIADLYRRMAYYEASMVYFDEVINRFYDTKYYEPALFYKAEILTKLDRYSEAKGVLTLLFEKYRQERERAQASSMQKFEQRAQHLLKLLEEKTATNGQAQN